MYLTIRPAAMADVGVITGFNAALAWETEQVRLDAARLEAGVCALLADPAKGFYVLAEIEDRVVGQTMITYEFSDWRNGVFWWLQSVYVEAAFRGRGVFGRLYRHLEDLARAEAGVCGLRLYVERANTRAQETYLSLGMRPSGYQLFELDFVIRRSTEN